VIGKITATNADELAIRQYAAFLQNAKMIVSATQSVALGTKTTPPARSEGTPHNLHTVRKPFSKTRKMGIRLFGLLHHIIATPS